MRFGYLLMMATLMLAACAAPPAQPTAPAAAPPATVAPVAEACMAGDGFPPKLSGLRYGLNAFLLGTDMQRVLTLAQNANVGWVRQQIHWHDTEGVRGEYVWGPLDAVVQEANGRGLRLLVSVVRSAPWADPSGGLPDDRAGFAGFMQVLAARYKGRVAAYEVWNEPNLAVENGGVPATPADYLATLAAAYPAIKAGDRCALVVSAPLAATSTGDSAVAVNDVAFFEELYKLEGGLFLRVADLVGMHPGGGPFAPKDSWPAERPEQSARYFRHIERLRALMERYGDPRQVWITEVGWSVAKAPGAPAPPVTPRQQGDFLVAALRYTRDHYPWVSAIFVWNLNFAVTGQPDDEKSTFGLLNPDWSPRHAYLAVQDHLYHEGKR
jgi:polysaccharide biosynthesis protein PslG